MDEIVLILLLLGILIFIYLKALDRRLYEKLCEKIRTQKYVMVGSSAGESPLFVPYEAGIFGQQDGSEIRGPGSDFASVSVAPAQPQPKRIGRPGLGDKIRDAFGALSRSQPTLLDSFAKMAGAIGNYLVQHGLEKSPCNKTIQKHIGCYFS